MALELSLKALYKTSCMLNRVKVDFIGNPGYQDRNTFSELDAVSIVPNTVRQPKVREKSRDS